MWQLYAFGSLLANATENVIDKAALVANTSVDSLVATFWRPFLFCLATLAIGLLGWLGPLHLSFHWTILLLAPVAIFNSLFYTFLLKRVEVTSLATVTYISPVAFLLIDTTLLHAQLSTTQILGILALIFGGIGFSLDGNTRRLKKELTWAVWGMFLFNLFWAGCEAYLFKYLHATYGMNGASFFGSLWLITSLYIFLIVCIRGKLPLLLDKSARRYIKQTASSKTCDALSSVLWAQALTTAAVSQVNAFEAIEPLVLFVLVFIAQALFKFKLNERLSTSNLVLKAAAVLLLIIGGFLV